MYEFHPCWERETEIYIKREKETKEPSICKCRLKERKLTEREVSTQRNSIPLYNCRRVLTLFCQSLLSLSSVSLSSLSIFSLPCISLSALCGLSVVRNSIYKSEYEVEKDQTHIISVVIININRVTWVREGDSLSERCLGVTQIQRREKMLVSIFGKSRKRRGCKSLRVKAVRLGFLQRTGR